jgi:hypothetical protein
MLVVVASLPLSLPPSETYYLGLLETLWPDLQYNALVHHQNSCRVCCLYICCADQHYKSQATAVKNSFCLQSKYLQVFMYKPF